MSLTERDGCRFGQDAAFRGNKGWKLHKGIRLFQSPDIGCIFSLGNALVIQGNDFMRNV